MKRLLFSLLVLSSLFFLHSCQKEIDFSTSTTNGSSNPVTGDFRAKIDGAQWVANSIAAASRLNGLISITGRSNDKKYITMTLTDSGVHNYTLNDVVMNVAAYMDSNLVSPFAFTTNQGLNPGDAGGSVNITSIDAVNKKLSGTFSFNVFRAVDGLKRTMTEGSFTNLSYATTLPPASSADTFKVKIAGTQWIPSSVLSSKTPAIPPLQAKLVITGTDASGSKSVGLIIPPDITAGTYTFDLFGDYVGQYNPDSDPTHSQGAKTGTLTILSHNTSTKRIRGNFSFHGEALLNPALFTELTEGYFAITYQ